MTGRLPVLIAKAASRSVALPLTTVRETMRPLHVEPLLAMPPFIMGLAMCRGEAVAVVDLNVLLAGGRDSIGRFVAMRSNAGTFLIAVGEVVGVRELSADTLQDMPLLLGTNAASVASAVGSHDERLLTLLNVARLVPVEVWESLRVNGAPS